MLALLLASATVVNASPKNILVLLMDDVGFGDIDLCHNGLNPAQCEVVPPGAPFKRQGGHLRTPRMKQLASEGQIMNNWYSPRAICTPSRAGLLSARDPVRFGSIGEILRIYPSNPSRGGYPHSEYSIAEYMQKSGKTTGYSGKWHIGLTNGSQWPTAYAPWNHGFEECDQFIAGSNGEPCANCNMNVPGDPNLYHMCTFSQIMNGKGEIIEQPIRWENITSRLLTAPLSFLKRRDQDKKPWFYQHSFAKAHVPWVPSRYFVSSKNGIWLDTMGEIDWAVGVILDKLDEYNMRDDTMIVLTSDNGPYKEFASTTVPQNCKFTACEEGPTTDPIPGTGISESQRIPASCTLATDYSEVSTAGYFIGGKGNTFEGGLRMPTVISWSGIPKGVINNHVSSSLDILPTAVHLVGGTLEATMPDGKPAHLDGKNIASQLQNPSAWDSTTQGEFFYWCGVNINAVRVNNHKVIFFSQRFTAGVTNNAPLTPDEYCDGGTCCYGGPGRLCTCLAGEFHDPPIVIDLDTNPGEDFGQRLDQSDPTTIAITQDAALRQRAKLRSVFESLGRPWDDSKSTKDLNTELLLQPNNVQIDACILTDNVIPPQFPNLPCGLNAGDTIQCPFIPEQCQYPQFKPYENCGIENMGSECKFRRPCCDADADYKGPWEYLNPVDPDPTKGWRGDVKCGCFKQPQGDSHFPDELLQSVCEWQKLNNVENQFCSPSICGTTQGLPCTEEFLFNYALYNTAYPESQEDPQGCAEKCGPGSTCSTDGKCKCSTSACCNPGEKECGGLDSTISTCVCKFDPWCCSTAWDGQCVEEAKVLCGAAC